MSNEIERKWVFKSKPSIIEKATKIQALRQGYLYEGDLGVVRIRSTVDQDGLSNGNFCIQTKSTGLLSREESPEYPIDSQVFETLYNTLRYRVEKTRYTIPFKNLFLEVDIYANRLKGLFTLEIEFSTVTEALEFKLPEEFDCIEVSSKSEYQNNNLAKLADIKKLNVSI